MPGSVDRPPDLIAELRSLKSRLAEIEGRLLNRVVAAARATVIGYSAANGASTVDFSGTDFDSATMWDAGQPSRLTIPVTGIYSLAGQAQFEFHATGSRGTKLLVNGSDIINSETRVQAITSSSYTAVISIALVECEAGDYVELEVTQDSGGALDVTVGSLSGHFIGVLV